ncbi:hypothetical protein SAMN06295974_1597 [Plantibacter flavus]|uniref:Lipoprotein n=1 Tax=Plantibacter flavus TaxID=150123 RepID=A0A3N2C7N9_9MICO|nr:hypothetical protein [Plantibacter flavus]ROR83528.1 hypothetical protein EDD42_3640 [Plantibacter flavus]SMG24393.1 hypothetical protein SAMN06295974_1597 [Plantibacter flavus]
MVRSGARRGIAPLGVVVVLGLAGCVAGPTEMPTPEIVWDRGVAPSSPLEDDPIVQAARESDIGLVLAENSGDFTIRQLNDRWNHRHIVDLARSYATETTSYVYPGPDPWEPVRIVERDDHIAVLEVCMADAETEGWLWGEDSYGKPFIPDRGVLWRYDFELLDGYWKRVTRHSYGYGQFGSCPFEDIPIGYFNPRPKLSKPSERAPVREPLPLAPESDEYEEGRR